METIDYLRQIYPADVPILLKDIRIGGKSKSAIKQDLYRAQKANKISRISNGVYYFKSEKEFGAGIGFEEVVKKKFVCDDCGIPGFDQLNVYGYYSGLTFLNWMGLTQQVPAIIEVTTNNTTNSKREFRIPGSPLRAWVRKAKTEVTFQNYKILQFLDMFHYATDDEIKANREKLRKYIKDNNFSSYLFGKYVKYYGKVTLVKIARGGLLDAFLG